MTYLFECLKKTEQPLKNINSLLTSERNTELPTESPFTIIDILDFSSFGGLNNSKFLASTSILFFVDNNCVKIEDLVETESLKLINLLDNNLLKGLLCIKAEIFNENKENINKMKYDSKFIVLITTFNK